MNWHKLPSHRRITLQLKWWREDTLYIDSPAFQLRLSLHDRCATERLDDNNTETPTK